jgi:hypothetical protein
LFARASGQSVDTVVYVPERIFESSDALCLKFVGGSMTGASIEAQEVRLK